MCLVNRERAAHGERALASDPRIERAAQLHTDDMVSGAYFEHVGPRGDTPSGRLREAGYISGSALYEVGENIGWGTLSRATPSAMVAAWMASPGHRELILDEAFAETAVGVSVNLPGSLSQGAPGAMYTQDFGVIFGE
jgi:uncharacterized protein YkwD